MHRHVYKHVCRHTHGHACRHVYGHVYGHMYRHVYDWQWLGQKEEDYACVVLEADPEPTSWTRRCIRQAGTSSSHIGHNYIAHSCLGHTYVGHNYIAHSCLGHTYVSHT